MAESKKPTQGDRITTLEENQKKLTTRLYEAEHIIKSLNIALIGLAYTLGANPKRIRKASPEDFLKFTEDNVHDIVRKADTLTSEVAKLAKEDILNQKKESENNG